MRTQQWLLASALGLVACAATEPERPRFYYPREVKREGFNATITGTGASTTDTTADSTGSTKRDLLHDIVSGLLGGDGNDKDDDKPTTTVEVETTKKPTDSGIVVGPSGIVKTKTKKPQTTSSHHGGLLDPINTIIGGIVGGGKPTSTNTTSVPEPTKPPKNTKTKTSGKVTTTEGGLLPGLSSILDPILPPKETSTTTKPTKTKTGTKSGPKQTTTSHHGLIPGLSSILPGPEPTTTTSADNGSDSTTSSPGQATTTTTANESTLTPTDSETTTQAPVPSDTSSIPDVPIVNSTTSGETGQSTELPTNNATVTDTTSSPPAATTTSLPLTDTTTAASSQSITTVEPSTPTAPPPTSTATTDNDFLPSTIVAEQTSFTWQRPTQTSSEEGGSSQNPIPTGVPRGILPNDHDPNKPAPDGSMLIQIGFLYQLNYLFVAKNPVAASQIFKYLPKALSESGGFPSKKVMVKQLLPLDTKDSYGYVTTLAQVYYPKNLVETLQMDIRAPASGFYHVGDDITRNLTAVVNPLIDLYGNMDNPDASGDNDSNSHNSGNGDDPFSTNDHKDQTSKQKATTAGIAVGAVSLGAIYGAAMFVVARRYKRKRQSHTRSSSVGGSSQASSEMRYTGAGSPALMGGALLSRDFSGYGGVAGGRNSHNSNGSGGSGAGNSARTANISAPLSAENSLGWN